MVTFVEKIACETTSASVVAREYIFTTACVTTAFSGGEAFSGVAVSMARSSKVSI